MHFIKCNRIIISYDPWSWHMRVVGCQGRWIFSRLAACLQSFGARGDSSFDPLLRGAGWKQAIRAWTRWCRCRRQASVTSSCGRMGASQNSAECMSPLFRRKTKEASPTSPVCHLLKEEFKPKSHFLQDMQQNRLKVSVNKQMNKQNGLERQATAAGAKCRLRQDGRSVMAIGKSADLINASRHHAFMHSGMYDEQKRWVPVPYAPPSPLVHQRRRRHCQLLTPSKLAIQPNATPTLAPHYLQFIERLRLPNNRGLRNAQTMPWRKARWKIRIQAKTSLLVATLSPRLSYVSMFLQCGLAIAGWLNS